MEDIVVRHLEGDRFLIAIRDHELIVDQPVPAGGTDAGPTPTEVFVGSLAAGVGFYAERFLVRHRIDPAGLEVVARARIAEDRPARVAGVALEVRVPQGMPDGFEPRLLAVCERCMVHESIRSDPEISIELVRRAGLRLVQGASRSIRQPEGSAGSRS